MASLLELENGDVDHLAGRVIVYVRYDGEREDDREGDQAFGEDGVIAMYLTTSPADLIDKFGPPDGGMAELAEKELEAKARRATDSSRVVPVYGAAIDVALADIEIAAEDVLYAGRFGDAERCGVMIQIAAQIYFHHYNEQLVQESGVTSEPASEQRPEPEPDTYDTVPRDQLSDHLQAQYIGPIMHALEDENTDQATRLAHDFIRFCGRKGPLTDDAYSLAGAIRLFPNEHGIPLLYRYFEKVLAITDERFEDAARLRDEVIALTARMRDAR